MTNKKTIQEQYDFKEGLYFNMTDEDYHAIPCLSATGLKILKTNPSKFWWWSWMNPDRKETETEAKIIGKAFHKRILEGRNAFYDAYASEFSCDRDDLIKTIDDIREALRAEKKKNPDVKISFKDKQDGMEKLFDIDIAYRDRMFDELKRDYQEEHADKIFLSDYIVDRAELSAKVIDTHPFLKTAFIGGFPEVSCVWFDKELKTWFKCRYDYLKVSAINDLKTFSRMTGKEVERYLPDIIAKYSYNIQATHYLDSMAYSKRFAKEKKIFDYKGGDDWLSAFAARECDQFHFIFQQKEEVPNAYEVIYSRNHSMHESSQQMIKHAVDQFHLYVERFGDLMWPEIKPAQVLTDDDYPHYMW